MLNISNQHIHFIIQIVTKKNTSKTEFAMRFCNADDFPKHVSRNNVYLT